MRIWLTGAGGLLGRCVAAQLRLAGIAFCPTGRRAIAGVEEIVDIADVNRVKEFAAAQQFTHVINCAAVRDLEQCAADPARAYAVNAGGVENLARAAAAHKMFLLHISTDYVFGGEQPPYSEEAPPEPLSLYGRSKLAGELAAATAPAHLVARLPALYRLDLADQANVASVLAQRLLAGEKMELDNECARFYSLADEVAAALVFLMQQEIAGMIHLSAGELQTKADFARALAARLSVDPERVIDIMPQYLEPRPLNSRLDTLYYQSLGGPAFTDPTTALAGVYGLAND